MSTRDEKERHALVQGTLDLLILRILLFGPQHGQGVARAIQTNSEDVLLVDHGALYPALQRMEAQGWIAADWGISSNNRRARFYTITAKGRKHLTEETGRWRTISNAMGRILDLKKLATQEG
jgi:transcriptional regulator